MKREIGSYITKTAVPGAAAGGLGPPMASAASASQGMALKTTDRNFTTH